MLIPIITEAVKTGDRSHDVDCLLFSGIWDERRSLSLSRTDSRISRIVCSVRHEVWSHTSCHLTLLFAAQKLLDQSPAGAVMPPEDPAASPHVHKLQVQYSTVQYSNSTVQHPCPSTPGGGAAWAPPASTQTAPPLCSRNWTKLMWWRRRTWKNRGRSFFLNHTL